MRGGRDGATANGGSTVLFSDPLVYSRIISRVGWPSDDPNIGVLDAAGFQRWLPFRAVDGTEVGEAIDPNFNPFVGSNYWLNPYFNIITTNEIPGAVTNQDGTGAELFQVLTGDEASGLGCGQKSQSVAGALKVPKCWLVIVPRGDQTMENADTPFDAFGNTIGVSTSPLAPNAWKNRIAIPLEFNPVDSPCTFADVERRIAGNEMAVPAVSSWQPTLCAVGLVAAVLVRAGRPTAPLARSSPRVSTAARAWPWSASRSTRRRWDPTTRWSTRRSPCPASSSASTSNDVPTPRHPPRWTHSPVCASRPSTSRRGWSRSCSPSRTDRR